MMKRPVRKKALPLAVPDELGYYRTLVALFPEAVLVTDHSGRLLEVNQRACELLGFAREELLGQSITSLARNSESLPPGSAPAELPAGEVLLKRKEGSLLPAEISVRPLPGDQRVFSLRDIRRQKEAEAALRRKTSELEQYFESSLDLLCIANTAGQFVRLNPAWEKVLGYTVAELQGRSFMDLVHVDDQASTLAEITRLSAQQEVLRFTNRYRCKDGTYRWIEWNSHPVGDLVYAVARDITERKQADAALRQANRQLRMLNECNEALLHHSDETELLTTVCRIAVEIGGYRMAWVGFAESDPAKTVRPVAWTGAEEGYLGVANVSWGDSARGDGPIGLAIRSGQPCSIQDLLADPRCAPWWPEIRKHGFAASCALPLVLEGRTLGALTIISSTTGAFDVTETALLAGLANNVAFGIGARRARAERKRAEQALVDEAAWRRILVEQSRDGIVVLDGAGRVVEANRRFAETLGYSPEEVSALHVWDWDTQWSPAQLLEILRHQDQAGSTFATRHRRKDGSVLDVEVSNNGTEIGGRKLVFCVIRDVTERKQAEEVLRRTQSSVDRARDAVYWIDHNGRFFYVNEAACRELGYTREELVQLTVMDIDPGLPASRWPAQWAKTRQLGAYTLETTHRAKDGRMIPVEVATNFMQFEGQEFHCTFVRDISERKRAEAAVRASERKLAAIFRSSPEMIVVTSVATGQMLELNEACARMLGFTREEMLGHTTLELNVWPTLADRDRVIGLVREQGQVQNLENRFRRKTGEFVDVLLSMAPINLEGQAGLITIATDVTERKRAEQERLELERRLLHVQKLESLGILAGGIAHDFNNLLMAILGNLDLALMDISPLSPARASLEQSVNAARRAADLTRQMLAYSGRGSFDIRSLDLCELVTENAHLFRASISKLVTLQVENATALPCIRADAGQIQQVVMNLITNASEAIGNHPGIVRLRTDVMDCDATTLRRNRGDIVPTPGRFVLLEVTDTGCGMDETTLQRLFEPFFTTKFTGRGLGMSALLGIVRGHQGAIFVDSVVGRGTTIQVLFPVDVASGETGPLRARQQPPGDLPAEDRLGTVLVVDDEDIVRRVCKHMLVRRGWKVIEAADGPEAVALFQQQPDEIALVVLDLSMPKMSGIEVFRALRGLRPDVRIILSSGYSSDQGSSAQLAAEGLAGFIQKPYTAQTLFHEVERALKRT